ncbi:protein SDA1 [Strigomonas culicis]|uniref:Protein SDA1 n=1 Tax=Strigomonas culicis TaxID=28005 RepID=S9V9H6_9TRYP|nr:protein SDA1 [Strigomonas culicis]|eukprot:EPY23626.1 protein SDA1 [Strigomonas culicis]
MNEPAFKGTLLLLQNRTRRDPESYRDEFLAQLEHFLASSATVAAQRAANPQYLAVLNYVCHVSHCFPKESRSVAEVVLEMLRTSKGHTLPTDLRVNLVKCLLLLRSKDLVSSDETFPILFMLLQERDKTIRSMILSHVVSDIRRMNMPGAKNGAAINRKMQNFLFGIMEEDDPVQARCAEMVMIDLYRRRVWCDERTVEVMTKACFSRHTPILRTALRFFLLQMPKISSVDDENGDADEGDPGRDISKMKQKLKIVKKTAKRSRILKRDMKAVKRKYDKEETREELFAKQHVDPIRLLRDPQSFVERLLAHLRKTSERFEVRVLYLNVIARTVSEHEVVYLPLYSFLERYMEPSQLHSTQLLALSSMCVHRMVPPDAVEPLLKAIANHFVNDRSSPDSITVGINTIREMCKRQPLAMNQDLLKDLVEYKNTRGEKGVVMAARALLQLFRETYPDLLPAKLRGSKAGAPSEVSKPVFGSEQVYTDIPGLDLLYQSMEDSNEKSSDEDSSDDDDEDSDSGEWIVDSDADPEAVDGDFVDVSGTDTDSDADDASEECPQLVDMNGAPAPKKTRQERSNTKAVSGEGEVATDDATTSEEEMEEEEDAEEEEFSEEGEEEEEEELEEDEEEEDAEGHATPSQLSQVLKEAPSSSEWYEDVDGRSERSLPASVTSSAVTTGSLAATRILTDADFEKIRKLSAQGGSHLSLRGKKKAQEEFSKRRHELIHGISGDLSAHDIEHFTVRRKEIDKAEKIEEAREVRKNRSKFEIQKKKKSKLNSTHGEHSKRGKLFQMTKRSQRVATKLKSSVADRAERAKEMKKKDIKFRIKRGWKA